VWAVASLHPVVGTPSGDAHPDENAGIRSQAGEVVGTVGSWPSGLNPIACSRWVSHIRKTGTPFVLHGLG